MSSQISREKLAQLTHLQLGDLGGRAVPLFPYYGADNEWKLWVPAGDDLQLMKMTEMVEGKYFGASPAHDSDIRLAFFEFMCKRAYFGSVTPFVEGIHDDLQNLSASLAKLEYFHAEWKRSGFEVRRFVTTELEYLFSVCRSVFDLLQESLSTLWPSFVFFDPKFRRRQIKKSFSKMLFENNALMSRDRIADRFLLPQPLADFYFHQGPFFSWLKEYRDWVSHSGKSFEFVFPLEKGFAVPTDS